MAARRPGHPPRGESTSHQPRKWCSHLHKPEIFRLTLQWSLDPLGTATDFLRPTRGWAFFAGRPTSSFGVSVLIKPVKIVFEYSNEIGTWEAILHNGVHGQSPVPKPVTRIPFEQAVVDAGFTREGRVEGYLRAIYGVPQDHVADLSPHHAATLGFTGRGYPRETCPNGSQHAKAPNYIRLMPDGSIVPCQGEHG